jgi:hypothetical protein
MFAVLLAISLASSTLRRCCSWQEQYSLVCPKSGTHFQAPGEVVNRVRALIKVMDLETIQDKTPRAEFYNDQQARAVTPAGVVVQVLPIIINDPLFGGAAKTVSLLLRYVRL